MHFVCQKSYGCFSFKRVILFNIWRNTELQLRSLVLVIFLYLSIFINYKTIYFKSWRSLIKSQCNMLQVLVFIYVVVDNELLYQHIFFFRAVSEFDVLISYWYTPVNVFLLNFVLGNFWESIADEGDILATLVYSSGVV